MRVFITLITYKVWYGFMSLYSTGFFTLWNSYSCLLPVFRLGYLSSLTSRNSLCMLDSNPLSIIYVIFSSQFVAYSFHLLTLWPLMSPRFYCCFNVTKGAHLCFYVLSLIAPTWKEIFSRWSEILSYIFFYKI